MGGACPGAERRAVRIRLPHECAQTLGALRRPVGALRSGARRERPSRSLRVALERAGFGKGLARGAVGISTKHSLALVNRGGATAGQLVGLAREIAVGVRDAFGVALAPEPVFVGHAW